MHADTLSMSSARFLDQLFDLAKDLRIGDIEYAPVHCAKTPHLSGRSR